MRFCFSNSNLNQLSTVLALLSGLQLAAEFLSFVLLGGGKMNVESHDKKKEYAADISSIKEARLRIEPFIHQTPVLTSESINAASGKQLFFKCECFQKG